ncbi:hypothetical protein [Enterococcus malodoratus]
MKETYIDQLSTNEVLRRINSSDQEIAGIVEKKITKIEEAVELACQKFL